MDALTETEKRILKMIQEPDVTRADVARELSRSESVVRCHLSRIRRKLHITRPTLEQLIRAARV